MNITKGRIREIIKEEVIRYIQLNKKEKTPQERIIESLRGELSNIFKVVEEAVSSGGDIKEIKSALVDKGMHLSKANNGSSIVVTTPSGDFSIQKVNNKQADPDVSIKGKGGFSFMINPLPAR